LGYLSGMAWTPFRYGQVVEQDHFTNRTKEIELLKSNFQSSVNTVIISPRRWGKSSLVKKAVQQTRLKQDKYLICEIDLYKMRTEEDFYKMYAEAVVNASASFFDGLKEEVLKLLTGLVPTIQFNPGDMSQYTLSLDWQLVRKDPSALLDLPEKIAQKKGKQYVVCIDEFQNLGYFKDPIAFQKQLRASWQQHQHTCYCMYGSKRHMMMEVFTTNNMPFYQFGSPKIGLVL